MPVFDAHMGPFGRATGKLKGPQKDSELAGKESFNKRTSLLKDPTSEKNESTINFDAASASKGRYEIPVAKSGHSSAKSEQNKVNISGKESFHSWAKLGKELDDLIYTPGPPEKIKSKTQEDLLLANIGKSGVSVAKVDNYGAMRSKSENKIRKGRVADTASSQQESAQGLWKGGERKFEETPGGGNRSWVPVAEAEKVEAASAQGLWKGGQRKFEGTAGGANRSWVPLVDAGKVEATSAHGLWEGGERKSEESAGGANKSWEPGKVEAKDSKAGFNVADKKGNLDTSSLTLSLGLNRIKTRSGPLHEGDVEGKREGDTGCSHHIDASEAKSSGHATTSSKELNNMSTNKGYPSIERGQGKLNNDFVESSRNPSGNSNTTSTEVATNSSGGIHEGRSMKLQRPSPSPRSSPQLQGCQRGLLGRGSLEGIASSSVSNRASPTSQPIDGARPKVKEHQRALQKIDHLLEKKVPCRLASFLDSDCSRNSDTDGTLKQLDVIKETELTKSEAVPRISKSIKKQKWPKDIKSFSHELGPKVGRPYGYPRPHSDNDLKELLGALRARFDTAKEEVDAELAVYAADLIEILEKNADCFLEWQEKVEDLLVLARRCAMMSPCDFRRECEGIVQEVDDKRQELPMGLLKQLHTRMLFILTRCTRLLQFQKEASPEEEGPIHKIQQCLKGVPSLEKTWASAVTKKGKFALNARKLLPEFLARVGRGEAASISRKGSKHAEKPRKLSEKTESFSQPLFYANQVDTHFANHLDISPKLIPFAEETVDSKSAIQDLGIGDLKVDLEEKMIKTLQGTWDHMDHAESGKKVDNESQETIGQSATPSRQAQRMPWGYWTETENLIEETDLVICRICEEEVPALHLEGHSLNCALADTCDVQGSSLDERLRILADNLEKITELSTPKNYQPAAVESPDLVKALKVNLHDNITSPKLSDSHGKSVESRFEEFFASDTTGIEELRGLSFISFKPHLGPKSEQGVASSSAGSLTPRSTLTTPRTSQLDLLWAERSSLSETEDISQINELADIARCVANQSPMEEGALEYLVTCMQDLQDVLGRNKIEALTVDTFGRRIENLLREKYLLILERMDQRKSDSASSPLEDDSMSTDDGSHSLKSTPTHPAYKDRITIDDFEILKPISRGAFGRVFLARKRTTGDLFAIKVLRKIDMIRKNAVENILAERDILITVRNPFVVRFFYSFTCRDNLYLVMEYLNGGDLYSLLKNMGCLEEHVARVYIAELVLALEYLHSLGVVHRDLKPDNVLIAHDGHIKLTDFGLSNVGLINSTDDLSGPGSSGTMLTDETTYQATVLHSQQREQHRKRSAVGTPDYLAPEILLGTEHGYTADWWSTGIILFEFLTGLPPFNAEHPQMIFDNILNRKIPWPSVPEDMSHEAQDLIDRLLTEDPNQRLGSKGASEVKAHPFFKDINWDTLARQKAAFVPNPESVDDTSYFTSRHLNGHTHSPQDFADSSDCSISSASTNSLKARLEEGDDECGDLAEFEGSPSVRDTFNNFSFKNLSQLASINYDLLSQTGKDCSKGHSRRSSVS